MGTEALSEEMWSGASSKEEFELVLKRHPQVFQEPWFHGIRNAEFLRNCRPVTCGQHHCQQIIYRFSGFS